MHRRLRPLANALGAAALLAIVGAPSLGAESAGNSLRRTSSQPAEWQGPMLTAQLIPPERGVVPPQQGAVPPTPPQPGTPAGAKPPAVVPQVVVPPVVVPPANVPPDPFAPTTIPVPVPGTPGSPLLDGKLPSEELLPPVVTEGTAGEGPHPVRPYGGGHPTDWSWGCGGSPYRQGPGMCDNWKVGCRWRVTVDGIVMTREKADLDAFADEMEDDDFGETDLEDPLFENFSHGPGGRITFTSQVPHYSCFQIQAAYEGIEAWNSSVVFERQTFEPDFFTAVITTETTTDTDTTTDNDTTTTTTTNTNNNTQTVTTTATTTVGAPGNDTVTVDTTTTTNTQNQTTTNTETNTENETTTETEVTVETSYEEGDLPLQPEDPFPQAFEQRSLHYRSNYHSGEMNFMHGTKSPWKSYCGFRYINFDDEINDFTDQVVQRPLPFEGPDDVTPGEFLAVAENDRLELFDVQNNLMGFQIGLLHDTVNINRRFTIDGFINGGVYYNKIKSTHLSGVFTTQFIADDTSTTTFNEERTDFSDAVQSSVRDLAEISYSAEANLSAVCRLNKCWSLRTGYQVLFLANLHLAEDAYLNDGQTEDRDLLFHGWHAGIECRR